MTFHPGTKLNKGGLKPRTHHVSALKLFVCCNLSLNTARKGECDTETYRKFVSTLVFWPSVRACTGVSQSDWLYLLNISTVATPITSTDAHLPYAPIASHRLLFIKEETANAERKWGNWIPWKRQKYPEELRWYTVGNKGHQLFF